MKYTTRPLSDRTWLRPASTRQWTPFDSTWSKTLRLLELETAKLGARDVVIEIDVREQDLKLDGTLRANARTPEHPAVVVAFDTSAHGPMLYRCDQYIARWSNQGPDWQQNVRAIALTLEALRKVDRYGATETGQQYTGFKALPAGRAMPASHMTRDDAEAVLTRIVGAFDYSEGYERWRRARAMAHPDRHGGNRALWDQVEQAGVELGMSRG